MSKQNHDQNVTRRGFFSRVFMTIGLILGYGTGAIYFFQFLIPRKKPLKLRKLLITSMEKLPPNGSTTFRDLAGREVVLVNTQEGLKAISTVCTHLGCKVYWEPENNRFFCPCHGGVFDINGNVVSGPPPRPLDNYPVEVDENDNVFVKLRES